MDTYKESDVRHYCALFKCTTKHLTGFVDQQEYVVVYHIYPDGTYELMAEGLVLHYDNLRSIADDWFFLKLIM